MIIQSTFNRQNDRNFRGVLLETRVEIVRKMVLLVSVYGLVGAYLTLLEKPFPVDKCALFLSFTLSIYLANRLFQHHSNVGRYALVGVLHCYLFIGIVTIPQDWMVLLCAPLILMSGLLVSNSSVVSGAFSIFTVSLLNYSGYLAFPIENLLLIVVIMVSMTLTAISTFYVTVSWYSLMHDRADRLLQQTRDRRAELLQTLKSLDIAYQTQQRLQQQLVYARHKANEARSMKERFAANISHELRTPLNLIMGFSEIMYLTPEVYGAVNLSPRLTRDVHQIYRNSKYLLDLIDDILDLSHIEMTTFTINFEKTDINLFMRESNELFQNLFHDNEVQLSIMVHDNLPTMEIDRTRLRQALLNLLTNARRFTDQGTVSMNVYATEDDLILQVIDTGQGIPEDKIDLIFDEFYQLDYSLSRSHGGAGLGLTITRRFVEAHGGKITAKSEIGVGTTFTINLPITSQDQLIIADLRGDQVVQDSNKPIVLVVDRDESALNLLTRHLKRFNVMAVRDVEKLHDLMQPLQPSAIIVNHAHDMPSLDYYQDTLIIECALPSIHWFVDQLGVLDCLPKPITGDILRGRIRQIPDIQTILLVDDDMGFVQLVQRTIELMPQPYRIVRAYDGMQALEMVYETQPDLILLDIAMPEMNGFDVLNALQSNPTTKDIPVILLTATRYIESELESNTHLKIDKRDGLSAHQAIKVIQSILNDLV